MSEADIIDGKAFAAGLRGRIGEAVRGLEANHGLTPGLAVVLVGENPASQVYVRNKAKQTREVGMASFEHKLAIETGQDELLALIRRLNEDPAVHGILVQLPLPDQIDAQAVLDAIDPAKDVDGFHVLGCTMLVKDRLGELKGLNAVIVGRSNIVGKPMAMLLLAEHCTVTVAHSRTRDLPGLCRTADILVAAVGRAEMVRGDWVKPGATVIDVGINRIEAGDGKTRLVGDVAFEEAVQVAGAITPVPGGVGPMTIACLLANTVTAACRQAGLAPPEV
jgi:methylenetetrahydrofolate dehydrogenase (NADP+)/methenyltetrahydrofolate cyclohydrolase